MKIVQKTAADNAVDIFTLARQAEELITENWQRLLEKNQAKLLDAYNRAGDMAYGTYCDMLFRPVHKLLKQTGVSVSPRLPGDFDLSREWGNADESDQQRWMWSTLTAATGEPLGTFVTVIFHDHTEFRVPRQPQIIALRETGKEAVVDALSHRSDEFKQALEFTVAYAAYLRSQGEATSESA